MSAQDVTGLNATKRSRLSRIKSGIPWWAKIALKMAYTRLNVAPFWLEPGNRQDNLKYAYDVFKSHFDRAAPPPGFTCLELGPGGMATAAILTRAFGGSRSIQVDVGPFTSTDLEGYRLLAAYAASRGAQPIALDGIANFDEMLVACGSQNLTDGLRSLRTIQSGSVDFVYSQSCLEHVRAEEFEPTMRELRRILKVGGVASHRVDLRDHLAEALNNLRFSDAVWESRIMSSSGFYTNRIRFREMVAKIEAAGFRCEVVDISNWPALPTPRQKLNKRFRSVPETELTINGFTVVCFATTQGAGK